MAAHAPWHLPTVNRTYASVLTTDDYLEGLLVLIQSLRDNKHRYGCVVLLTSNISARTRFILAGHGIPYKEVHTLPNPTDVSAAHRWFRTYSKLHVFSLAQYDKIIYLDVDMLLLENIDALFERPHMSAASAGSLLPDCSHWVHMNSGLFVAVPSTALYQDMMSRLGRIEQLTSGGVPDKPKRGSDQDFLNAYYPAWTQRTELHLDHKYNMLHYHIDEYSKHFGYTLTPGLRCVAVLHYASQLKPWHLSNEAVAILRSGRDKTLQAQALRLWFDTRDRASTVTGELKGVAFDGY